MTDVQDPAREFRELDEKLRASGLTPEEQARWEALRPAGPDETTGVIWEQGPVEQPAEPLPDLLAAVPDGPFAPEPEPLPPDAAPEPVRPPPLPPADPAFAAVLADVPEISADDVTELHDAPAAAVAVVEEDAGEDGEVVSLDVLMAATPPAGATPPPLGAASLAPPLPPPASPQAFPPPVPAPLEPAVRDPFAASPSFVSGEHRIVLHTVEGQVLRGSLANADLDDDEIPLIQPNGAVARIPAIQVKAVFFMLAPGARVGPGSGARVRVTFADGRQLAGLSPGYDPGSRGFFVLPLDDRTHTARVWVYRAATRQVLAG
ncbi:MAG TPA: hypothetical protein VFM53_05155 [Anaeromyxobacteraceae bacterium]|nr:hypothetical protein [Anaeromyxobacteraceae bacterium]